MSPNESVLISSTCLPAACFMRQVFESDDYLSIYPTINLYY